MTAASTAARLTMAAGHMCQIIAKPKAALSAAMTKPAPVFFGMWIAIKPVCGMANIKRI